MSGEEDLRQRMCSEIPAWRTDFVVYLLIVNITEMEHLIIRRLRNRRQDLPKHLQGSTRTTIKAACTRLQVSKGDSNLRAPRFYMECEQRYVLHSSSIRPLVGPGASDGHGYPSRLRAPKVGGCPW